MAAKTGNDSWEHSEFHKLESWGLPKTILDKYHAKGIRSMFAWQVECLSNERILNDYSNLIYSAPTSAGKTLVSEILSIKTVLERHKKVIVILPFVSVVREKMYYFKEVFKNTQVRVDGFMGSYNPPGGFKNIHIAICTIEKANNLINRLLEEGALDEIGTVVVDELHLLGDPSRGYLLELLLTKLLYMCKRNDYHIQIIGMSATLPNLNLLAGWLRAELYQTSFRPIPLYEQCYLNGKLFDSNFKEVRALTKHADLKDDVDDLFHLCMETICASCSVLIFCNSKVRCENVASNIATMFKRLGSNSSSPLGAVLRKEIQAKPVMDVLEQLSRCPVGLDDVLKLTISFGVAFHHAGLTIDERDIIEGAFRRGALKVLVATSTLSSGVNLPARRVIIRSPAFAGNCIDILSYKQMIGRAGRMGHDTAGESILICQPQEKNLARQLITSKLRPIASCLQHSGRIKRAILEIIASGVGSTSHDIEMFLKCTLLHASDEYFDTEAMLHDCIDFFVRNKFIEKVVGDEKTLCFVATPLARACLSSSLPPEDGLVLFEELEKARQMFVLESDLHVVYLVTPYSSCSQWDNLDWSLFHSMWASLPPCDLKVAELVGISEQFIMAALKGLIGKKSRHYEIQIHRRFYTALALRELINEKPLSLVAKKFNCSRGLLQSLQQSAGTFSGMVTIFCKKLGWFNVEVLISQFQNRLHFGVQSDLIDLMRLPVLNSVTARALYNCGIETIIELASAKSGKVEHALQIAKPFERGDTGGKDGQNTKNIWITGKDCLNETEAALIFIEEARCFLKSEIGLEVARWGQSQSESERVQEEKTDENDPTKRHKIIESGTRTKSLKEMDCTKNDTLKEEIDENKGQNESIENRPSVNNEESSMKTPIKCMSIKCEKPHSNLIISLEKKSLDQIEDVQDNELNGKDDSECSIVLSDSVRDDEKSKGLHRKVKRKNYRKKNLNEKTTGKLTSDKVELVGKNSSSKKLPKMEIVCPENLKMDLKNDVKSNSISFGDSFLFPETQIYLDSCQIDQKTKLDGCQSVSDRENSAKKIKAESTGDSFFSDDDVSMNVNENQTLKIQNLTNSKTIGFQKLGNTREQNSKNGRLNIDPSKKSCNQSLKIYNESLPDSLFFNDQTDDFNLSIGEKPPIKIHEPNFPSQNPESNFMIDLKQLTTNGSTDSLFLNGDFSWNTNENISLKSQNAKNCQSVGLKKSSNKRKGNSKTARLNIEPSKKIYNQSIEAFMNESNPDSLFLNDLTYPGLKIVEQNFPRKNLESKFTKKYTENPIEKLKTKSTIGDNTADKTPSFFLDVSFPSNFDVIQNEIVSKNDSDIINTSVSPGEMTWKKTGQKSLRKLRTSNGKNSKIGTLKRTDKCFVGVKNIENIRTSVKDLKNVRNIDIDIEVNHENVKIRDTSRESVEMVDLSVEDTKVTPKIRKYLNGAAHKRRCKSHEKSRKKITMGLSEESEKKENWKFKNPLNHTNFDYHELTLTNHLLTDNYLTNIPIDQIENTTESIFVPSFTKSKAKVDLNNVNIVKVSTSKEIAGLKTNISKNPLISLEFHFFKNESDRNRIGSRILRSCKQTDENVQEKVEGFVYEQYKINGFVVFFGAKTCNFLKLDNNSVEFLRFIFENEKNTKLRVMTNAGRDVVKILRHCFRIEVRCQLWDCNVCDWILRSNYNGKSLDEMINDYVPNMVGYKNGAQDKTPTKAMTVDECCMKSMAVFYLIKTQRRLLANQNEKLLKTYETEMTVIVNLTYCELYGIGIDFETLNNFIRFLENYLSDIQNEITQIAKRKVQINSNSDVAKVLGLSKSTLNKRVLEHCTNPLAQLVLLWRKMNHIVQIILRPVLNHVKNNRIHSTFLYNNVNGRVSMEEPNLQNIPRDFQVYVDDRLETISCRGNFEAGPGNLLVAADYCQLELRILAHFSGDGNLLRVMNECEDVFRSIAAEWYKVNVTMVTPEQRHNTKQLCYGIVYGMGAKSLGEQLNVDETKAYDLIESFHATFTSVRPFIESILESCRNNGFIETLGKRRRYFPNIDSAVKRQAVNAVIQGSAADIVKRAIVNVAEKIRSKFQNTIHLVHFLHDEMIYEVEMLAPNRVDEFVSVLRDEMEQAVRLCVSLPVKVKCGRTWGELKEVTKGEKWE